MPRVHGALIGRQLANNSAHTYDVENGSADSRPPRVFVVAGELSGDQLGAKLMATIKSRPDSRSVSFSGLGGDAMIAEGLRPHFPLSDVAVMGALAIARRLPLIVKRVYQIVDAVLAFKPDVLVIIDSPEFTHPIAKRIRKRAPHIPIIDYVSPSVWAWRPGRARKMKSYVDHVLALLPFEPEVHRRLDGPPCTYVGHPLIERLDWIRAQDPNALAERLGLDRGKPVLVLLPGSRPSEVHRLMEPFRETIARLYEKCGPFQLLIPAVASVRPMIEEHLASWSVRPILLEGEQDKFAAFRLARAALAASGTVTLELALAGTPMVVAYRVDPVTALSRYVIEAPSAVLANLILQENIFPEYLQDVCTPDNLTSALEGLMQDGPERQKQRDAFATIHDKMTITGGTPSDKAAEIVMQMAQSGRP